MLWPYFDVGIISKTSNEISVHNGVLSALHASSVVTKEVSALPSGWRQVF